MKIVTNQKKIDRNLKLSKYTLYISLAMLALGFIWSIRNTQPENSLIGWLILIPSYFLVQISIYLSNKWGRSPRPDEIVTQSLKGLKDEYTLYNFSTSIDHVLVGPSGIWIINPYHQRGEITYDDKKGKYHQKGGPSFIGKYFGQEALPSVHRDVKNLKNDLATFLQGKSITTETEPAVVNLFIGEEVEIKGKDFPYLTLKSNKFKEYLRKHADKNILSADQIEKINKKITSK